MTEEPFRPCNASFPVDGVGGYHTCIRSIGHDGDHQVSGHPNVTLRSVVSMLMVGNRPYDQALLFCQSLGLDPTQPIVVSDDEHGAAAIARWKHTGR